LLIARLVIALAAGVGTAIVVAVLLALADIYVTGHGNSGTMSRGTP